MFSGGAYSDLWNAPLPLPQDGLCRWTSERKEGKIRKKIALFGVVLGKNNCNLAGLDESGASVPDAAGDDRASLRDVTDLRGRD